MAYTTAGDPLLGAMQAWAASNGANPLNRTTRALYDQKGQLAYSVDGEGYVTEYQYDKLGQVRKQIRYASAYAVTDTTTKASLAATIGAIPASAAVTEFQYDNAGRLTDVIDPANIRTRTVLDELGRITQTIVAHGTVQASVTSRFYDAAGRVTAEISPVGTYTAYTYDPHGNVLSIRVYETLVSVPANGGTQAAGARGACRQLS